MIVFDPLPFFIWYGLGAFIYMGCVFVLGWGKPRLNNGITEASYFPGVFIWPLCGIAWIIYMLWTRIFLPIQGD